VATGKNRAVSRQLRVLFDVGTIRELTDGQLLERFTSASGESAELAFAALVERHGPMVLRVCQSVLANPHDSQDAFQATFLVLVKKARGLWVRDSLGPWLHQVAYRTASCVRLAAARRNRHEHRVAVLTKEARAEPYDDLACVLHEEIERLPQRFRAPLILCDLEGRTHEQAARHLGWPVGTVKSRQARGRERLRDRLRRRGVAPEAGVVSALLRPHAASPLVSSALVDCTITAAIQFLKTRTLVPGSAVSFARGVLSSMYVARCLKIASIFLFICATTSGVGLLARKGTQVAPPAPRGQLQSAPANEALVTTVEPGKLSIRVIERGVLEPMRFFDAYCLVEGRTTITQIVPELSAVKKGQIVCRLDPASLRNELIKQSVTVKSAEAEYETARLAREVAEIAVTEYAEGIYKQELGALKDAITAAQSAMHKADARLERTRLARKRLQDMLAARGAANAPSDIVAELDIEDRLESAELTLQRESIALDQARFKQDLLQKITMPKTLKELKVDVERKQSDELAKKSAWALEDSKAKKLERQIAACTIKSLADGILVYANDPDRAFAGNQHQIEEGATVRERQKIFSVVDLIGPMHVNTKVHESQVDKIGRKMKARIRVDAFANETFEGAVQEVAPLPDSMPGLDPDNKVYSTKVKMDRTLPGLKPGMTALVEILVAELDNVLRVPVEAVVRFDGKDHVAVKKSDGAIDWREVTLGLSNDKVVAVKQGIAAGDRVALSPRDLLTEELKRETQRAPTRPAAKPGGPRSQP
jgi:HlyD family secretion protein